MSLADFDPYARKSRKAVPHRQINNAGLSLAVLSAATFGTSGSFASSLLANGWTPGAAVTMRVVIAALVLTAPAFVQLRSARPTARGFRTVVLYGLLAVAAAQLCYFNAVQHLSVAVALLLEYSGILLVIAWMRVRHGHRPGRLTITGSAAALVGLIFVLDIASAHHVDFVGVLWGFGAAVGLAAYFVISSATEDALPPLVVAWGGLTVAAATFGAAIAVGVLPVRATSADVTLMSHRVSWIVPVLGMSVIAAAIAYVTGIAAARRLGAKVSSFVGLTEVLFAVGFAWVLLGQRLDVVQAIGAVFVVGGIALVRLDELRTPLPATPARSAAREPSPEAAPTRIAAVERVSV
jgi:drug/metabolite transporter (DMT)-like permease